MTYAANATWSDSAASNDPFLQYFLGDNREGGTTITVSNVPFDTYDVIVYVNSDTADTSFLPVAVNDVKYIGDPETGATVVTDNATATFGQTRADAPQYGLNTIRVNGITRDTLAILGSRQQTIDNVKRRCNIAGFQIVESVPLSISVNYKGTANSSYADRYPETLVGDTAGFSGLVSVLNANWNEVETPAGDGSTPEIIGAKDSTGAETTATISLAMGGGWTLLGLQQDVQSARTTRIGKMGLGYADASKNATPEVTLKDIPYTKYSVILYYATDKENKKWAPAKVTSGDTMNYYYYGEDGTLKNDGSSTSTWGSSSDCASSADNTATLDKDIMRIDGLSGDLSIDLDTTSADTFGGLCGFQIVCTGEVFDPTLDGVMSLNFATGGSGNSAVASSMVSDKEGDYGLAQVPAATWVDLTGNANESGQTVTTLHGKATAADWSAAKVKWKAKNTWSYTPAQAEGAEPFLPTYLDDGVGGDHDGAKVTVESVPFEAYDAIVYLANDAGRKYRPLQVNGSYYTYDAEYGAVAIDGAPLDGSVGAANREDPNAFGDVSQKGQAALGVNALRVNGLTGDFSLKGEGVKVQTGPETGLVSDDYDRSGIAAVQLVKRTLIAVDGQADWATLTAGIDLTRPLLVKVASGATIAGDVTLPADAILDFSGYTFGETAPFTDSLTMNGGTIRLPDGFESGRIATFFSGNNFHCFIAGKPVWLSKNPGDGALSVSYMWTGYAGDNRWSTPGNWSSLVVPGKNADVLFMPAASRPETVILDEAATVASVTITGPESGTAASLAIQAQEGGSLTVSGQMLTTGNVTVTQSADITVNGATEMYSIGTGYPEQPCQAGFHVHQGTWKILSGTLSVPTDGGTNDGGTITGEAGISGNGTLIVGGEGASGAKLAVRLIRPVYYNENPGLASGTLRVATDGTLTASSSVQLSTQNYTTELAGGTMTTPSVRTFNGLTVSEASTPSVLKAPDGLKMSVSGTNSALTGEGNLTLQGAVAFSSAITADYTGVLTAAANSTVTLGENRPNLSVVEGATVIITPTAAEQAAGVVSFGTSMADAETVTGVTFTVAGVESVSAEVADGKLTLKWESAMPTLATSGDWSASNWTVGEATGQAAPTSGTVVLDGTAEGGITVTLDIAIPEEITSIILRGNVTLETSEAQSTIPACVTPADGAVLTIGANISGASLQSPWELPAGTTLKVSNGFTSFAYLTLNGAVEIAEGVTGSIEAPSAFDGGLTVNASNVTLTGATNVGVTLALNGNNIVIQGSEGSTFYTDNGTTVVNKGTDNAITGVTGLNGSLAVNSGTLALTLAGDQPTITSFLGATIAKDATLTLAGPSGWFPATGAGTLVLEGDYRPLFSAVTVGETSATDIPAKMILSATADEQDKGLVSFQTYTGTSGEVTIPDGFVAEVKPYDEAPVWVPVCVRRNSSYIDIYNVPAPNGLTGLDDAVALTLRQAAAKEGITNGNYTVQLKTKGGQTTIASPDADALNDVLGCFTGLTATADGTTLTYAYDFGIAGLRRTAEGWVVTAKVQGENPAQAGFAKGNAYVLSVTAGGTEKKVQLTGESGVVETSAATGTVELTVPDEALQDLGDEPFTVGVSVSRTAQQL